MPKEYQNMPPEGELMASIDGYPEGLLAIPNEDGYTQYRSTGHSTKYFLPPTEEIHGKELLFSNGGGCYT